MEDSEFKFEPVWVACLSLFSFYLLFLAFKPLVTNGFIDYNEFVVFAIIPMLLAIIVLPMAFKMLTGVPAIQYTETKLVDNVFGISIGWEEIQDLRISGISKPFLSITLKNKRRFFSNIDNPVKRVFLRLLFAISPADVSINLAFVAGSNESISSVAQVYWNRFYGRFD